MKAMELFKLIVEAAKNGQRCPSRNNQAIQRLISDGWIETRVYAQNWRVVRIVRGEYSGLETQASPHDSTEPWVICRQSGTIRRAGTARPNQPKGSVAAAAAAPQKREPSKPRVMSSGELAKFLED